jgi:hypothetical protein
MIIALSFVPPANVKVELEKLRKYFNLEEKNENILRIFDWFEKQYCNFEKRCLTNSSFVFWNVYDRTLNSIPRTSNSIEGYHRHLNARLGIKQQSILKIGRILQEEQLFVENHLIESLYIKNNVEKEDDILKVVQKYEMYYHLDYLIAVVLNFNFAFDN